MAVKADVRRTTNRSLRVGDRRKFFGRDELGWARVSRRYHVGRRARESLIVHQ